MIRYLDEQARNHPNEYRVFYAEFSTFIKEGVCHDFQFTDQLSKLLLFESSTLSESTLTSLDDYISRCPPEQKQIYYLVAPTRESALGSPYYEIFQKHGKEVLLLFNTIDDFVMTNIKNFSGAMLRMCSHSAGTELTLLLSHSRPDIFLCSSIMAPDVFRSRDGVR
jgi:TNF receptor-associated protein 1